jgi:hypothetical protein
MRRKWHEPVHNKVMCPDQENEYINREDPEH